jgi:hypothetical protein
LAHTVLLVLFTANLFTINLQKEFTIKPFYLRFWVLFFLEYILFGIWALV